MPKCYYSDSDSYSSYDEYSDEECSNKTCDKCKRKTSCKPCEKNKKIDKKEKPQSSCDKCKKKENPCKPKCSDNESIQYVKDGQNIIITIKNCK